MATKEQAQPTAPLNLVQKLARIRQELDHIEKKGRNAFQNYDYLRAEDIAGEMGDRLAAMNVILARRNLNFVQDTITIKKENGDERTDVHVIVTLDYVFIDGDDLAPGIGGNLREIAVASIGEGRDSGDKAVAKAMTNALKYALTQPLMMRVGDDPEADAEHDKPEKRRPVDNRNARSTENGDDGGVKATRIALIRKAKDKLGDDMGMKWLKEATAEMRTTSDKLTIDQMLALSERISKLTKAEGDTQPPEVEESDIGF